MPDDESKKNVVNLQEKAKAKAEKIKKERRETPENVIANFKIVEVDGKEEFIPANIKDTIKSLRAVDNLYKIGEVFYGKTDLGMVQLPDIDALFGFVQENDKLLYFKTGAGFSKPKEIHSALYRTKNDFELLSKTPTYPALESTFYDCETVEPKATGALDQLLEFFNPATDIDAAMIKATMCAPAWSGGYGKKPLIIFRTDENADHQENTGKSTLLKHIGNFYNGRMQLSVDDSYYEMARQIVMHRHLRIISFDNVQKPYFGNGDIESAITSPFIQGHQLYKGAVQIPNHFTWIATINNPNLSADLASRSLVIRILPPKVRLARWECELERFMTDKRQDLLADIGHILTLPVIEKAPITRFPAFDDMILHKLMPEGAAQYVKQGQDEINSIKNDDSEEKITDQLYGAYNLHTQRPIVLEGSPEDYNWWIPSGMLIEWLTARKRIMNTSAGADGKMLKERLKRFKHWELHYYRPKVDGIKLGRGYFLISKTEPKTQQVYFVRSQNDRQIAVQGGILPLNLSMEPEE